MALLFQPIKQAATAVTFIPLKINWNQPLIFQYVFETALRCGGLIFAIKLELL